MFVMDKRSKLMWPANAPICWRVIMANSNIILFLSACDAVFVQFNFVYWLNHQPSHHIINIANFVLLLSPSPSPPPIVHTQWILNRRIERCPNILSNCKWLISADEYCFRPLFHVYRVLLDLINSIQWRVHEWEFMAKKIPCKQHLLYKYIVSDNRNWFLSGLQGLRHET